MIIVNRNEYIKVEGGVPQGAVFGPLLWKILYDDIFSMEMPDGVTSIVFADDLVLVEVADEVDELNYIVCESLRRTNVAMKKHRETIERNKTKAVVLKGPRKISGAKLSFEEEDQAVGKPKQLDIWVS